MKINSVTPPNIMTAGEHFARVPQANINRSVFDRSHAHKTTFDSGYLIPIFRDIMFPGDTLNISVSCLARFATLVKPIMDRMNMDIHFWAVPIRLIHENWPRLMGERRPDPDSSIAIVTPKFNFNAVPVTVGPQTIWDYMRFPLETFGAQQQDKYHTYYMRAYNCIWNEQYRDENLQDSVPLQTDDGPDNPADYVLLRRGKRHDYFTSALPEPQKGNAVTMSLAGDAPVVAKFGVGQPMRFRRASDDALMAGSSNLQWNNTVQNSDLAGSDGPPPTRGYLDPNGTLEADLSNISAFTINDLRIAIATQQVLERDARSGTRYTEIIRAHFGVSSPDARMQRPELIGTLSVPLSVNQVEQTAISGATPQGNLAAWAAVAGSGGGIVQSFTEHCIVIGLASARADYTYQYGVMRDQRYSTRYDFMLPEFANLGEQAIRNEEIFYEGTSVNDDGTWAYQERFAEMRYMPSQLSGLMRSAAAGSLDVWHLAEEFASLPAFNDDFIQENPPVDRVIAVPSEPHFIAEFWFNYRHTRALPIFSVPGLTRI